MKNINSTNLSGKTEIDLLLTTRCNLACKHCLYVDHKKFVDLDDKILKIILDKLPVNGSEVHLLGGEPLCRTDIVKIVDKINKKQLNPQILTNGFALTDSLLKKLHQAGLKKIGFSLDGTKSVHNFIRGKGDVFQRVIRAIKAIKKLGYIPKISSAVHQHNKDSILKLIPFLDKLGVQRVLIEHFLPINGGTQLAGKNLNKKEWQAFIKDIKVLKKINKLSIRVAVQKVFYDKQEARDFSCVCKNLKYPIVDSSGNYYPCIIYYAAGFPAGNLNKDTWEKIHSVKSISSYIKKVNKITGHVKVNKIKVLCPAIKLLVVRKELDLSSISNVKGTIGCFHKVELL
ncbi:MAG: radical SAM protein [Candidatus Buchananbacteria bacterium]